MRARTDAWMDYWGNEERYDDPREELERRVDSRPTSVESRGAGGEKCKEGVWQGGAHGR